MSNQPIGILDSGVGGLSVWQEVVRQLPNEAIIYIADSQNCPYGSKTPEEIYSLAKLLIQFLIAKEVKLCVIACNTITVTCLDRLRADFPQIPLIGMVPVVKKAVERTQSRRIGILSTTATANSAYQKNLIHTFAKDCEVINIGTDTLVPLIEAGNVQPDEIQNELQKVLLPFKQAHIDTLALGCSHFPFLRDQIQKVMGKDVFLLDSAGAIARQVQRVLTMNNIESVSRGSSEDHGGMYKFYTTGSSSAFISTAQKLLVDSERITEKNVEQVVLG